MKLAVECECLLMQKTLEVFLDEFLDENPNVIVSDVKKESVKPVFYINDSSPYMNLPFTKEELVYALEEFAFAVKGSYVTAESLESKISALCDDFKDRLIHVVKEHYE